MKLRAFLFNLFEDLTVVMLQNPSKQLLLRAPPLRRPPWVVFLLRKPPFLVSGIAFTIENTKKHSLLTSFWSFKNFCWSSSVDAKLTGPHLICERDPRVDKQNADLMILAFFCFVNVTLASANWTWVRGLRIWRLLNTGLVYETHVWVSRLREISKYGV